MVAREPRVRRRGFFLHSPDGNEPDVTGEHENPEGFGVRVRVASTSVPRADRRSGRSRTVPAAVESDKPPDQIRERDWQPSTGTLAPLIQLARRRREERDDRPDLFGAAEPAERQFPLHEFRHPLRDRPALGGPTIPPETESTPAPRCSPGCCPRPAAAPSPLRG